jgi:hypothetical protein
LTLQERRRFYFYFIGKRSDEMILSQGSSEYVLSIPYSLETLQIKITRVNSNRESRLLTDEDGGV